MGATISYAVYAPGIFMHLKFKEKLVNIVLGKKLKFVLEIQSNTFFLRFLSNIVTRKLLGTEKNKTLRGCLVGEKNWVWVWVLIRLKRFISF